MIQFNINNTNNIACLTLSEKTTITNAYYLFELINDQTKEVLKVVLTDVSGNKERINLFNLAFTLTKKGFYKYNVYEQASAVNTNTTGLKIVDNGKLLAYENETDLQAYEPTIATKIVYGG